MLQKLGFLPGFNKQVTSTGAESQWTGGENVRFRYGTPEKIGGWSQLGESKLTGAARALHHLVNKSGNKFAPVYKQSLKLYECLFNRADASKTILHFVVFLPGVKTAWCGM